MSEGMKKVKNTGKKCYFCDSRTQPNYKDVETLTRFVKENGAVTSARKNGCCPMHQRKLNTSIKRARHIALM